MYRFPCRVYRKNAKQDWQRLDLGCVLVLTESVFALKETPSELLLMELPYANKYQMVYKEEYYFLENSEFEACFVFKLLDATKSKAFRDTFERFGKRRVECVTPVDEDTDSILSIPSLNEPVTKDLVRKLATSNELAAYSDSIMSLLLE